MLQPLRRLIQEKDVRRSASFGFGISVVLLLTLAWVSGFDPGFSQAQNRAAESVNDNATAAGHLHGRLLRIEREVTLLRTENQRLRSHLTDVVRTLRTSDHGNSVLPIPGATELSRARLPKEVTFAGEIIPLEKWDVRERLEREFYWLLGEPALIILLLKRSGRYFPYIEEQLRKHKLPDDLKYLAIIESNLSAKAYSYAGAAGVWQFIRSTGRRYGMRYNSWLDERRDLEKSTTGALRYLSDLYKRFESWPLAMASYNAGEARVSRALVEQDVDTYYELRLPPETERYVFKIIAAKLVLQHPEGLGFSLSRAQYYRPFDTQAVQISVRQRRLHLREVAKSAGTYFRQIKQLNPAFRRDYLPRGKHEVNVPREHAKQFARVFTEKTRIAKPTRRKRRIVQSGSRKVVYEVRRGDSLWGIAEKYKVSVSRLRKWNGLSKGQPIFPGDDLTIFTR